ncbi:MAG: GAF domain-containing protein, partial [Pyrinomonadaceae bacterium]
GWVLANRKPFCNTDPKLDLPPDLVPQFAAYRTLAVMPISKDKEMHGAVALYSSALAEYDADRQRLLEEAVRLVASALSGAPPVARTEEKGRNLSGREGAPAALVSTDPAARLESELTH